MKIYPVLDLLDGVVVRGVAGRRGEYRPIESRLVATADPLDVARGFRDKLGLDELYVADLDAILHGRANTGVFRALVADGFRILVDRGLTDQRHAQETFDDGATSVIAGLETCPSPELLQSLCERFGSERIIFSLDLKAGRPLGEPGSWDTDDPFSIAMQAVNAGIRRMIVLDLAQVGVGQGVQTLALCEQLRRHRRDLELITGGGVRGVQDLRQLHAEQIDGVLVASALHDGRIGRAEVEEFRT